MVYFKYFLFEYITCPELPKCSAVRVRVIRGSARTGNILVGLAVSRHRNNDRAAPKDDWGDDHDGDDRGP